MGESVERRGRSLVLPDTLGHSPNARLMVNLSCVSTAMFHGICRAIGRIDWIENQRFAHDQSRQLHADEINSGVRAVLAKQTSAYWIETFKKHDVLCGPVQDYDAFLEDAHVRQSGFVAALQGGGFDGLPFMLLPGTAEPNTRLRVAPAIGENTREILQEHGYCTNEIDRLLSDKVIFEQQIGDGKT